jgi:hypothetical protein
LFAKLRANEEKIKMSNQHNKPTKTPERIAQLAQVAENLSLPPHERWRAMAELAAQVNPQIALEQKEMAEEMEAYRAATEPIDPTAKKSLKHLVSIPKMTWLVIASSDPGLFDTKKTNNIKQSRKTNKISRQLDRAFPEFRAYRTE